MKSVRYRCDKGESVLATTKSGAAIATTKDLACDGPMRFRPDADGLDIKMHESETQPPLSGIKVIEIAMAMAGPFCGMMLADYGADVIKIERLGEGDDPRAEGPSEAGQDPG